MDISDKVALITGGASGLGLATANKLLSSGAKIMLVDLNEDNVKKASENLGDKTAFAIANVTDEDSVAECIKSTVDKFGGIHIVVNCAGIGSASKTVGKDGAHPLQYFKTVIDINLTGTFNVLRLAAVEMGNNEPAEDGECGVIINTASVAAFDGQIGQAAYSASKGGIVGLTLPIAREFSKLGIRVCTIAPGLFETPMLAGLPDKAVQSLIDSTLFPHRLGKPSEYGQLVLSIFENDMLNGETIRLDGSVRLAPR